MQGKRVLRYVGNREQPEKEVYSSVEYALRDFPLLIDIALGDLRSASKHIPNPMFSDFEKFDNGLFLRPQIELPGSLFNSMFRFQSRLIGTETAKENPKKPAEVDFEVNMMEALIGWKSWYIDSGILKSNSGNCLWHPEKAVEATCHMDCAKVPAEHHTCGIYASESRSTAEEYGDVLGIVYGWGRYIRHEGGWKAQFAYPRCFYLSESQLNLVDQLKQYHVPIYVSQPVNFYNPSEEGYDGYWTEEENGDCGAAEVSNPDEERSSHEDDED